MASLFQALRGSAMPKRLLRYALLRLDLLDSDALDLENLDLALGRKTVLDFRDVGIRLEKLERLLKLPETFTILKAKVLLLRVTIPIDFYSSPITIEVDGVDVRLKVQSPDDAANRPKSQGARARASDSDVVPNTVDLAQSFLEQEPQAEKKELEAALAAETQDLGASLALSEDESDDESIYGTGEALSLPVFFADFLQGIIDRIQVQIRGVTFQLDVGIPVEPTSSAPELVTFQLALGNVNVEGVTTSTQGAEGETAKIVPKEGKRHISLENISAFLISEANVFSTFARTQSVPPTLSPQSSTALRSPKSRRSSASASVSSQRIDEEDDENLSQSIPLEQSQYFLQDSEDAFNIPYDMGSSEEEHGPNQGPGDDDPEPPASSLSTPRASMYQDVTTRPHIPSSHSALVEAEQPIWASTVREAQSVPTFPATHSEFLESTSHDSPASSTHSAFASDDSSQGAVEDLTQSHLFSHEEAESMYMSAFSHAGSIQMRGKMPGSWDSGDPSPEASPVAKKPSLSTAATPTQSTPPPPPLAIPSKESKPAALAPVTPTANMAVAETATPTPPSPPTLEQPEAAHDRIDSSSDELPSDEPVVTEEPTVQAELPGVPEPVAPEECATPRGPTRLVKQLLSLNSISIYAPSSHKHIRIVSPDGQGAMPGPSAGTSRLSPHPPGAFSMHASVTPGLSAPGNPSASSRYPAESEKDPEEDKSLEIILSPLEVQFDASIGFLLAMVVSRLLAALNSREPTGVEKEPSTKPPTKKEPPFADVKVTLEELSLLFLEHLAGVADTAERCFGSGPPTFNKDVLLQAYVRNLQAYTSAAETTVEVESFTFGYSGEDAAIISFDRTAQLAASVRDAIPDHGAEISVKIKKSAQGTQCEVLTLPLLARLDLRRLDETFSWFGGLSSFLSMGSSMTSNAAAGAGAGIGPTARATGKIPDKPRGVRFEAPVNPDDSSASGDNKINMRIGAVRLDLVGKDCSVVLETSALKFVNRNELLGVSVGMMRLHGPYSPHTGSHPPISIAVLNTRFEYMMTPKDPELERLLELISPSKLKFDDNKDEIMVETLLRQRRKGPVLRITTEKVSVDVGNIPLLNCLPSLGEDLARLGTVAKYLPEDDRPGLLTLALIRNLDLFVDAGGRFGVVNVSIKDFDSAHITVPSLVALAVGGVTVTRNRIEELVGSSLLPPATRAEAPVLMMRMIGDVIEPTVIVKMRGLNIEYRVPTIMDILDLAEDATPEDFEAGLAASVANLSGQAQMAISNNRPQEPPNSGAKGSKPPKVELSLLDCVLGLNPLGLTSKMGVVFIDTRLEVNLADERSLKVLGLVKKAAILLIDDVTTVDWDDQERFTLKHAPRPSDPRPRHKVWSLESTLCARGFVNICQIHSATATVQVSTHTDGEKLVDVEVKDNLVVLETCADSTQTMISLAGALKPPTPPSKEVKFKTQIMPVQDLFASIAADAFGKAEGAYNFDEDFGAAAGQLQGGDTDDDAIEDEAGYLGGLDSQYFQGQGQYQRQHQDLEDQAGEPLFDVFDESASSILSDRTTMPYDSQDGDVDTHFDDLHMLENYFGEKPVIQGLAHRWNSARATYEPPDDARAAKSPLKARIRDVHLIWNLFDGYDWQRTRDVISKTVQEVEAKAYERRARSDRRASYDQDFETEEETVIGDFLFNSIYIGIPASHDPRELQQAISQNLYGDRPSDTESVSAATTTLTATASRVGGGIGARSAAGKAKKRLRLGRSRHHKIAFELQGVNADVFAFPRGSGETESSVDLRVRNLEIFDHVPGSTWKKFATYDRDAGERELDSHMLHLELLNVRPVPDAAATEIVLKATVLPLRLHVDQDALDFITRFFEFKDDSAPAVGSPSDIAFIQRAEINSIPVRLDFKPKRVDYAGLRSGHTTEFMNFLILDASSMQMRHCILYGIPGFERLGQMLNDIWMPDIKHNQLPGVLAGLAPVRSLVNVGSGFRTLVEVPYREYRRDGRIVRSLGKGAATFARTTGTEIIKLGAKVAVGTQYVLQGAEGMLVKSPDHQQHYFSEAGGEQLGGVGVPGSSTAPGGGGGLGWDELDDADDDAADAPVFGEDARRRKQVSLYADQPTGVMQGLRHAYSSLSRDLSVARDAIVAVPVEVMESSSATGAAKAVMRRAPTIIFRPAIGATKAIGQTLMGATNSIDPANLRRMEDKYKSGPGGR